MTCGCPVVISEQPALVEVGGDAALHCRADDADGIARQMHALHEHDVLRSRLSAAGRERAKRFTWAATARALLEDCQRLQRRRSGAS
jgi:glycosyltransferase involved in cell wall biosynthesis